MTRRIRERIIFTGVLVADVPVHVGGGFDAPDTDLPLAVNGRGEYYIPGTSITGVLRQWFARVFGEGAMKAIFGYTPALSSKDEGFASFILVEDAPLQDSNAALPEVRDGVGIDRFTGAAAHNIKYDRQVLPRGSRFDFRLTLEVPDDAQAPEGWPADADMQIARMIASLMQGGMRFGAARSRGLGRMRLEDVRVQQQALLTREGILQALRVRAGQDAQTQQGAQARQPFNEAFPDAKPVRDANVITIAVRWKPVQPIMVKAEAAGLEVDMLPLFTGDADSGQMMRVIPGSSIKGVLRACAERIMNTLRERDVPSSGKRDDFLRQLDADPLINALFGARGKGKAEQAQEAAARSVEGGQTWAEGLSALFVDDCHCTDDALQRKEWEALFGVEDREQPKNAIGEDRLRTWQPAFHVAIDRFTGAAAENQLYSVLEPFGGDWEPLQLQLDLGRLPDDRREAAKALLLLVLRELAQERIALGFGTHRGMGAIEVQGITFAFEDESFPVPSLAPGDFEDAEKMRAFGKLNEAWQAYLRQQGMLDDQQAA